MRLPTVLTSIHKWIGVVIGIQVLLWVAGGLVMSAFPIELVRGETRSAQGEPGPIRADEFAVDLRAALDAHGPVTALRSLRIAGHLYFEGQRSDAPALLIDARDGRVLSRLVGDGWPRTVVIGAGDPPVTVTDREVVAGDRTLFSLAEGGRLLDAGGGAPGPTEIATSGLEPGERTTALALLALVSACWEESPSSATE